MSYRRGTEERPRATRLRTRVATAGALVMVVGLVLLASARSATASNHFLGVTYPPFPSQVVPNDKDLSQMNRGGVGWVRWPFLWGMVQPQPGEFDWTIPDVVIGRFASQGISVLPEVYGSAGFAKTSGARPPLRPASARKAWKEFLRASAERYGPDGTFWAEPADGETQSPYHAACKCSSDPLPIRSWQIWNEPNLASYFRPRPSPVRYAKLLRMSHDALRSVDPKAKIIMAGLTGGGDQTSSQFLNRLYRTGHGIKGEFDAVALHPYAARLSVLWDHIGKARRVMRKHHDAHTPVWITELGWSSSKKPSPYQLNKGKRGQKRLLERSFQRIIQRRHRWHIRRLLWFYWRDPAPDVASGCSFCSHAGLIKHQGKPKPAFRAFKHSALR